MITVKAELATGSSTSTRNGPGPSSPTSSGSRREALADVRRAAEGYRDVTLPGELARARAALRGAASRPTCHAPTTCPRELRELFAWAVREGVTNVDPAQRCIALHGAARSLERVEVADDGAGPRTPATGAGNGLRGLRERAAAVGAVAGRPARSTRAGSRWR